MPIFRLVDTADETGAFLPYHLYDNGKDASEAAKAARASGKTLRVVRQPDDNEIWKARQRAYDRCQDGTWTRLASWVPTGSDHFLHKSEDADKAAAGMVACYPSLVHLVDDRPVVMAFSRYLSRFFGEDYGATEIARLTERYMAGLKPSTFQITRDRETVVRMFRDFRHCAESCDYVSCMAKPGPYFGLPDDRHPAEAYVGPGASLSLAYLETEDGTITARAVISEGRKFYVRVYGLEEHHKTALKAALDERGFRKKDGYEGETLWLDAYPNHRQNAVIVPYVDGNVQTCDSDGLICDDGEIDCETTSGFARVSERVSCDNCGERVSADDTIEVRGSHWCPDCVESSTWTCEATGEVYPDSEDSVEVNTRWGSENWCQDAADDRAFWCEHSEAFWSLRAYTAVTVVTPDGEQTWSNREADDHAEYVDGTWYHPDCVPAEDDETDGQDDAETPGSIDDDRQLSLVA